MNVNSDIGWSVLLENDIDIVITAGVCSSRAACSKMLRLVSLTRMVFSAGSPSGNADENAHSSSSAVAGGAAGAGLAKSKIECGWDCWGVDCRTGEASAAKGSTGGAEACCLVTAAACCCWNRDGCGVVDCGTG